MVQFNQSLPICLSLSATGGILEVFASALLAYPDAKAREEGIPWSKPSLRYALIGNIIIQILAKLTSNLFAPWYGPVSLVSSIFVCAQLLTNMVIFGWVLGYESLTKDMRVGIYVILAGAILVRGVGPSVQDDQDVMDLLSTPHALCWSVLILLSMLVSASLIVLTDITRLGSERFRIAILLVARVTAYTVNLTVSKMMVLDPTTWTSFGVTMALKIVSGAVMTYAMVVHSTSVFQPTFVPLDATLNVIVNGLTGIIIWEDWKVVDLWLEYVCVFCLLVMGSYLLLGEVELFTPYNRRYGEASTLFRLWGKQMEEEEEFVSSQEEEEFVSSPMTPQGHSKSEGEDVYVEGESTSGSSTSMLSGEDEWEDGTLADSVEGKEISPARARTQSSSSSRSSSSWMLADNDVGKGIPPRARTQSSSSLMSGIVENGEIIHSTCEGVHKSATSSSGPTRRFTARKVSVQQRLHYAEAALFESDDDDCSLIEVPRR